MYRKNPGFTIVELLIVIVVIAILAAISIVAYTGIQESAKHSAIQSDLRNAFTKASEYILLHNDGVAPQTLAEREAMGISPTRSVYDQAAFDRFIYCVDENDSTNFGFAAHTKNGAQTWYITRDQASVQDAGTDFVVLGPAICGNILNTDNPYYHWAVSETGWRDWVK